MHRTDDYGYFFLNHYILKPRTDYEILCYIIELVLNNQRKILHEIFRFWTNHLSGIYPNVIRSIQRIHPANARYGRFSCKQFRTLKRFSFDCEFRPEISNSRFRIVLALDPFFFFSTNLRTRCRTMSSTYTVSFVEKQNVNCSYGLVADFERSFFFVHFLSRKTWFFPFYNFNGTMLVYRSFLFGRFLSTRGPYEFLRPDARRATPDADCTRGDARACVTR